MSWYNDDTRESYIKRQKGNHMHLAEHCHQVGIEHSMWLQLFYWAMCEDVYGEHWDNYWNKQT